MVPCPEYHLRNAFLFSAAEISMAKRTKAKPSGNVRPSGIAGGGSAWSRRLLETFVAVAQTGSMSAAAEQLGLSQPAVSQAVSALENATGTKLFDRTVRPPKLTLQARSLLPMRSQ